jgi:class 3 adenylate cyclase
VSAVARVYSSDDVVATVNQGDYVANADHWPGDRAERVADVQTQYLRAIAVGLAALAVAVEALADSPAARS